MCIGSTNFFFPYRTLSEGEGGGAGQVETVPETPPVRVVAKEQAVAVPETKTLNPFHAAYHNKFEWILHDANLTMPPPT